MPLNFLKDEDTKVDYLVTGSWSFKAAQEAKKYSKCVNIINATDKNIQNKKYVSTTAAKAKAAEWKLSIDKEHPPAYIYYCDNETVDGVELPSSLDKVLPKEYLDMNVPIISDMSSNFMSRPVSCIHNAFIMHS